MNKLIKGAITGAAGIALLLGGAGTFAAWNDSATIGSSSQTISTGTLKFDTTPANQPSGAWYTDQAGTTAVTGGYLAVPGSSVYYKGTATLIAKGTNLSANFGIDPSAVSATLGLPGATGTVSATVVSVTGGGNIGTGVNGVYPVTASSNPIVVTVIVKVTFDATNTDAQGTTITLANLPLTLTQVTN